jgi:hypothetical protein
MSSFNIFFTCIADNLQTLSNGRLYLYTWNIYIKQTFLLYTIMVSLME